MCSRECKQSNFLPVGWTFRNHRDIQSKKGESMDTQPGPFIRLFDLPAAPDDDELAQEIGKPFGPMYGGGVGGNPAMSAGFTYLGQFIDHDLDFDSRTSLSRQADGVLPHNFRTAAFDLDSLYGLGPKVNSYFYDEKDPRKFVI